MSHAAHATIGLAPALTMALVALVYVRGWAHIRRTFPKRRSARQLGAFLIAVLSLWIAIASPLSVLHHQLLSIHMVQHVLLMAVVPPLALIGAPGLPLLYGIPWDGMRRVATEFLRCRPIRWLRSLLMRPTVCWLAATVALIGWHVPAAFELGLRSHRWHDAQLASFLATGLLFWAPVVGASTRFTASAPWSMPLYLFTATLPCDALSAFLVFCGRVVYPAYLGAPRPWNISPLGDQECAGALMWVSITFLYLVPAVIITMKILSPAQRREPALRSDVVMSALGGPEQQVV
jgi:putative membrane protein